MNHFPNILSPALRPGNKKNDEFEPPCFKHPISVAKKLPSLYNIKILGHNVTEQAFYIQDYFTIQNECLDKKVLFEDKEFPPINTSLTISQVLGQPIEWKRPHEIVDKPQFISSSWTRSFIEQGELGARWVLGAVANMAANNFLFANVVPEDQSFTEKYAGIFHFRFWQYGKWLDVVVDDRLPTCNGKMKYMHAPDNQEFWSALLEKAYAKLYGSYEALNDMTVCEALEDFTGGIIELYNFQLNMDTSMMGDILLESFQRCSIIVCSKEVAPVSVTPKGIKTGMCYGVTKLVEIDRQNSNQRGKTLMVRLRYPFGVKERWTGSFSEYSPDWHSISAIDKEALNYTNRAEEFWIPFDDIIAQFDRVEICHLHPDTVTADDITLGKQKWDVSVLAGSWTRGKNSGGCRNDIDTFWKNPQYFVTINSTSSNTFYSIIIGLTQKYLHSYKGTTRHIGYIIYRLPDKAKVTEPLSKEFFENNVSIARSALFVDIKELTNRFKLPAGRYCIIPSTFNRDDEAEFVLRVFSESKLTDCKKELHTSEDTHRQNVELSNKTPPTGAPLYSTTGWNNNYQGSSLQDTPVVYTTQPNAQYGRYNRGTDDLVDNVMKAVIINSAINSTMNPGRHVTNSEDFCCDCCGDGNDGDGCCSDCDCCCGDCVSCCFS